MRPQMNYTREKEILSLVPGDVENVLDIGSAGNIFRKHNTTCLNLEGADINQDLNKNQRIPREDNSFDLVVLSQVLEHLTHVEEIISESFRLSRKYILVGLPNEVKLDNRIRFLFGKPVNQWKEGIGAYFPYGHKHLFNIPLSEQFVRHFFGEWIKKDYIFGVKGGSYIPFQIRKMLARSFRNLFAGEVYYLIDVRNFKNDLK